MELHLYILTFIYRRWIRYVIYFLLVLLVLSFLIMFWSSGSWWPFEVSWYCGFMFGCQLQMNGYCDVAYWLDHGFHFSGLLSQPVLMLSVCLSVEMNHGKDKCGCWSWWFRFVAVLGEALVCWSERLLNLTLLPILWWLFWWCWGLRLRGPLLCSRCSCIHCLLAL